MKKLYQTKINIAGHTTYGTKTPEIIKKLDVYLTRDQLVEMTENGDKLPKQNVGVVYVYDYTLAGIDGKPEIDHITMADRIECRYYYRDTEKFEIGRWKSGK